MYNQDIKTSQVYSRSIQQLRKIYNNSSAWIILKKEEQKYIEELLIDTNSLIRKLEDYKIDYGDTFLTELCEIAKNTSPSSLIMAENGKKSANKLTKEQRKERAIKAAKARWEK